jgi:hypothetical protein
MKTFIKTAVLLTLIFNFSLGCAQKTIKGDGNISTKTVTVGDYDAIKSIGFMDIHLQKGTEGNITVTTDDNLHEQLEIVVKDKELIVKTKEGVNLKTKKGILITIPFEDISEVSLSGSGDITSKDKIIADEFKASVHGSGDIVLELEASKAEAIIDGSGDLTLTGSAAELKVKVVGSGDFWGFNLKTQTADAAVTGSGDARVYADKNLKARIIGSGDITYKGNPENKDLKTIGSGDIYAE